MFNADTEPVSFVLPASRTTPWRLAVDTAKPSPLDFCNPEEESVLADSTTYIVESRSSVVLVAR